jgi:CheY-like chemotaxis protein
MEKAARPLVLIVEDEQIIARNIARYLVHMDYEVSGVCSSASEAMESVRGRRPDIVLMDIRIDGEEDGVVVAERLHDLHGIPVIYLSALLDDETVQRVKATQPFGFLAKPFSQKELQVALEIALYKSAMERRLAEQEVQIQRLIDGMGQGFCLLDSKRRIRYANRALARLLNHPAEDLSGRSIDAWVNLPTEGSAAHQAWIDQRSFEVMLIPAGGKDRPCVLTPQHLFDAAGLYSGSFLGFTDLESVVRSEAGNRRPGPATVASPES